MIGWQRGVPSTSALGVITDGLIRSQVPSAGCRVNPYRGWSAAAVTALTKGQSIESEEAATGARWLAPSAEGKVVHQWHHMHGKSSVAGRTRMSSHSYVRGRRASADTLSPIPFGHVQFHRAIDLVTARTRATAGELSASNRLGVGRLDGVAGGS